MDELLAEMILKQKKLVSSGCEKYDATYKAIEHIQKKEVLGKFKNVTYKRVVGVIRTFLGELE